MVVTMFHETHVKHARARCRLTIHRNSSRQSSCQRVLQESLITLIRAFLSEISENLDVQQC